LSTVEVSARPGVEPISVLRFQNVRCRDSASDNGSPNSPAENGGEKVDHGSGGMSPLRAA